MGALNGRGSQTAHFVQHLKHNFWLCGTGRHRFPERRERGDDRSVRVGAASLNSRQTALGTDYRGKKAAE